jgi:hypothetical protein
VKPSALEALLIEHMAEPEARVHDMTDNGGYGLVRWSRPLTIVGGPSPVTIIEHIVHRWAVVDTDGNAIEPRFYLGGYYDEEEFARADYRRREDPAPTYAAKDRT